MIHYAIGTPLWVELVSPDTDASIAFYSDLLGWDISQAGQTSGSRIFSSGDQTVAGVRPLLREGFFPQWITFLSTDDADRTSSYVSTAGGKIVTPTVLDQERGMMVLQDKGGAVFGIFQHDLFAGAQAFNQPVSLTFNQLTTQDPEEGKRFYSQVFGWQPRERDMGGGFTFTYFLNGGRAIAGLMAMNESALLPHWKVYFAVEDIDVLVSHAVELGGKVLLPAIDGPFGRFAELSDPQGAAFSMIQQTPEVRAAAQMPMGVLPF